MNASETLTRVLLELDDRGQRTPCQGSQSRLWLSDDAEDREAATFMCAGCPVLAECHAAAEENRERFGVWAARDRTPKPKRAAA